MRIKRIGFVLAAALVFACAACAAQLPKLRMLSTKDCPACVQMEKVLKKIDSDYAGRLTTEHVYLEDHPEVAQAYEVRYVPTLIFVDQHGREIRQEIGYRSLAEVLEIFKKAGVKI